MSKEALMIDVHIPFCTGRCVYCEEKRFGQNIGYLHRYMRALEKEIAAASEELADYSVRSVHLHPDALSLLGPGALDDFLRKLEDAIPAAGAEWIVEAMPGELTPEQLHVLQRRHAVNRVVLQLMGLSKEALRQLHRPYTENIALAALGQLGRTPVEGLDLEYAVGVPGQTPEALAGDLARLADLAPGQISLRRFHDKRLPASEQREYAEETDWGGLIAAAEGALGGRGYLREGKGLHFAQPGRLRFECSPEAVRASAMGFGIGAVTRMDGLRYRNTTDFALYLEHSDDPSAIATLL